jgi:GNAT superfamily N-acetyltransferase
MTTLQDPIGFSMVTVGAGAEQREISARSWKGAEQMVLSSPRDSHLQVATTIVSGGLRPVVRVQGIIYCDIYLEVAKTLRGLGWGTFFIQELKRECIELGAVPTARCAPSNKASARALEKAGFAMLPPGVSPYKGKQKAGLENAPASNLLQNLMQDHRRKIAARKRSPRSTATDK